MRHTITASALVSARNLERSIALALVAAARERGRADTMTARLDAATVLDALLDTGWTFTPPAPENPDAAAEADVELRHGGLS